MSKRTMTVSRIARAPSWIPEGVDVSVDGPRIVIKGRKGECVLNLHEAVQVEREGSSIRVKPKTDPHSMVGTFSKLLRNALKGVDEGFERKLQLRGVGKRAALEEGMLVMSLGFSHPVRYRPPTNITLSVPTNTEIIVSGCSLQSVSDVAAKIRAFCPPEVYKGKGIRLDGERVLVKESKKKSKGEK